ncbi:hypothetical protein BN1708_012647 [Verticillium longisporum]|uniref:Uncharacterized protein n=1 Tax=Verticillium longisporum TaxID=100787 RepID=A0A0G4LC57_VERLO|nr:hypothetical protein BN1708_012647 [Verticillium longisporum]
MAHPSKITGRTGCPRPRTHTWGVLIHATGDVKKGFKFDVKRSLPLQWVEASDADQKAVFLKRYGKSKANGTPIGRFQTALQNVKAKSGTMVLQRNCQTWIVESADELVARSFFEKEVAAYLDAIEQ